ncbi:VOC family protein [Leptobacterium flavescens]|uniref:VOC family protein n=1 Tax=Leptobacterium flavescens TaxID=472055 RepID=A0A6P0UQ65_9FLAO|nr:VOC family protein [Leptobacterium flavescens]NER15481.1 VOC family protein [Leptobacterium flavescens]
MKHILITAIIFIQCLCYGQKQTLKFDHLAILTQDLKESVSFYTDVLFLEEIEDATQMEHIRWFSMGGSTQLHIIEDKENSISHHQGVHFALSVNDLDAFRKHLSKKNIQYKNWFGKLNATNPRPDGVRQIYLQDPDGYWIEINGK